MKIVKESIFQEPSLEDIKEKIRAKEGISISDVENMVYELDIDTIKELVNDKVLDPGNVGILLSGAARAEKFDLVKFLVDKGADVRDDISSLNPLVIAAGKGNLKIFRYIFENSDIGPGDEGVQEAYPEAMIEEQLNIIKYLIDQDVELYEEGLNDAIKSGNSKLVKLLLDTYEFSEEQLKSARLTANNFSGVHEEIGKQFKEMINDELRR